MARDAGELARLLAGQVVTLAAELLPAGKRTGQEWRCGSLAGDPGQSLAVHLSGSRAGVWADFTTGERGDALDLVAQVLYRGDTAQAMTWARGWLGLGDGAAAPAQRRPAPAPAVPEHDPDAEARQGAARRLFFAAAQELAGTPAAAYLRGRGIDLGELKRQPRSLRFAASLPNRETDRPWPALLGAVVNAAGEMTAVHRTWLHQAADGCWTKAPLRNAKMSLGHVAGGSIRLWRGASGKPLAQAPEGETVVIGEGIETCLSVAILCPELRVLAAVSLANLARIALPATVRTVILAADNDGDNAAAARALQTAVNHYAGEGRTVRIARSPVGKDFNDALTADMT